MSETVFHPASDAPEQPGDLAFSLPPDPDDVGPWLGEPPEEQTRDTNLQAAFLGDTQTGLSEQDVAAWYNTLSPVDQQFFAEARASNAEEARRVGAAQALIEKGLIESAPELLSGELPQWMAEKVGSEHVLGINQSGIGTAEDAQQRLTQDGGVNMAGRSLDERFVLTSSHDPGYARHMMINGFYGPLRGGKMVIALPVPSGDGSPYTKAVDTYRQLEDVEVPCISEPQFAAINPKYVAGFIDMAGAFHPNVQFMTNQPAEILHASAGNDATVDLPDNWV